MAFQRTLKAVGSEHFPETLLEEMTSYVGCLDVRQLTRCGGHASDPSLDSISKVTVSEKTINFECQISFNDGDALDCSGHCGGTVTKRTEDLRFSIQRESDTAVWETLDGVIYG